MKQVSHKSSLVKYLISPRVFISSETSSKYGVYSLGPLKELWNYFKAVTGNTDNKLLDFKRAEFNDVTNFTAYLVHEEITPAKMFKIFRRNSVSLYVNLINVILLLIVSFYQISAISTFLSSVLIAVFLVISTVFFISKAALFSYYNHLIKACKLPCNYSLYKYLLSGDFCFDANLAAKAECIDFAFIASQALDVNFNDACLGLPNEIKSAIDKKKKLPE